MLGGVRSNAVWNFSKKSSVLVAWPVLYTDPPKCTSEIFKNMKNILDSNQNSKMKSVKKNNKKKQQKEIWQFFRKEFVDIWMKRNACFNLVLWQKVIHFIFLPFWIWVVNQIDPAWLRNEIEEGLSLQSWNQVESSEYSSEWTFFYLNMWLLIGSQTMHRKEWCLPLDKSRSSWRQNMTHGNPL